MQLRKEAWKKFRTSTGFEPVTSRYRCDALPTELWSHWCWEQVNCGFICSRERIFFQASLRNCINCVHCDDHFFILKTIIIVHFTLVETTFRQTSIQNQSVLKISWPLDRDKITFKAIKNYRYSLRKTVSKRLIGYFVHFHGEEFMLTLQFGNVINFSNHISRFYCGNGSRTQTSLRPMIIRTCNGYRARLWWTLCNHDIDNKNNYY